MIAGDNNVQSVSLGEFFSTIGRQMFQRMVSLKMFLFDFLANRYIGKDE